MFLTPQVLLKISFFIEIMLFLSEKTIEVERSFGLAVSITWSSFVTTNNRGVIFSVFITFRFKFCVKVPGFGI